MHCHSTASQLSRLGVQRSLGLPECATPPQEVYELAKQRGMDFVTITDHDTIDGCLELADRPDCFVSEELTARFAGELQVLYAGRLTSEKGVDLLAESFLQAHRAEPRLHLLLAGKRMGEAAVRSARGRSWERAFEQLTIGYRRALGEGTAKRQARSRAA